jgi:hypothetical protein
MGREKLRGAHLMKTYKHSDTVIPAEAGIQRFYLICLEVLSPCCGSFFVDWIPASAGMTNRLIAFR